VTTLLEGIDLNTYYGASHVLHGVTLAVGAGETVTLMGRNGMGKTTTIRSLLGLTPPRSGEVRVRGQAVTGWAAYLRKPVRPDDLVRTIADLLGGPRKRS